MEQEQRERRKLVDSEADPVYFKKEVLNQKACQYLYKFGEPRNYWEDKKA